MSTSIVRPFEVARSLPSLAGRTYKLCQACILGRPCVIVANDRIPCIRRGHPPAPRPRRLRSDESPRIGVHRQSCSAGTLGFLCLLSEVAGPGRGSSRRRTVRRPGATVMRSTIRSRVREREQVSSRSRNNDPGGNRWIRTCSLRRGGQRGSPARPWS